MRVVIIGCGRLGSSLARRLDHAGHEVTIIDQESTAFRRLGPKYRGQRLVGTGLDEDVLKRAGIQRADVFVSATQGDNRNIMAAQIARDVYRVPKVIARIYDPVRAQSYREAGIHTFCPTTLISGLMFDFLETDAWPMERDYLREYLQKIH